MVYGTEWCRRWDRATTGILHCCQLREVFAYIRNSLTRSGQRRLWWPATAHWYSRGFDADPSFERIMIRAHEDAASKNLDCRNFSRFDIERKQRDTLLRTARYTVTLAGCGNTIEFTCNHGVIQIRQNIIW